MLLKALQSSLQPRSKQEARDLYQIGAQQGGILSRQHGELCLAPQGMVSHDAGVAGDLEAILAEQTLQNSGMSPGHQPLIRAAVHGDITTGKICEELVAHSRIHDVESRSGKGFGGKTYKGYNSKSYGGKGSHRPWARAYHAQGEEYYDREDWEARSQSLGGYEDYESCSYTVDDGSYAMDKDEVICVAYVNILEEGLDEADR